MTSAASFMGRSVCYVRRDNLETSVAIHTARKSLFMAPPSALNLLSNFNSSSSSVLWSLRTSVHHFIPLGLDVPPSGIHIPF